MSKDVTVEGVDSSGAQKVLKAIGDGATVFRLDSGLATPMSREGVLRTILGSMNCKFRIVDNMLYSDRDRIVSAPILYPKPGTVLFYFDGYDIDNKLVFKDFLWTAAPSEFLKFLVKEGMCYNSKQEAEDAYKFFKDIATQKLVVK